MERALEQHPDAAGRSWVLTTLAEVAARYGHRGADQLLAEAERAQATAPTPGGAVQLAMASAASATGAGQLPCAGLILQEVEAAEPAARSQRVFLCVDRIANDISRGRFAEARTALDDLTTEIDTLGVAARPLFTPWTASRTSRWGSSPRPRRAPDWRSRGPPTPGWTARASACSPRWWRFSCTGAR
ncbi:hypothetical protein FHG89_16910 [Micromonospora orduensis]|uniref:Uncharacterized protein n=1 Tax=Micromonospora orduensis TaxID=1420891 RepID=A0A5C4QQE3_9ACTN|nr:hypothetical protein [Micromonospora orduensis]TNH27873.1 hypothetical protein FHG89_16910 [Micromonospora orduensis]